MVVKSSEHNMFAIGVYRGLHHGAYSGALARTGIWSAGSTTTTGITSALSDDDRRIGVRRYRRRDLPSIFLRLYGDLWRTLKFHT